MNDSEDRIIRPEDRIQAKVYAFKKREIPFGADRVESRMKPPLLDPRAILIQSMRTSGFVADERLSFSALWHQLALQIHQNDDYHRTRSGGGTAI
jgi:hypothetical protein